jgi:hypothetical protein
MNSLAATSAPQSGLVRKTEPKQLLPKRFLLTMEISKTWNSGNICTVMLLTLGICRTAVREFECILIFPVLIPNQIKPVTVWPD